MLMAALISSTVHEKEHNSIFNWSGFLLSIAINGFGLGEGGDFHH